VSMLKNAASSWTIFLWSLSMGGNEWVLVRVAHLLCETERDNYSRFPETMRFHIFRLLDQFNECFFQPAHKIVVGFEVGFQALGVKRGSAVVEVGCNRIRFLLVQFQGEKQSSVAFLARAFVVAW